LPLTGLKHTILLGAALDLVLGIYLLARSQASLTLQRLTIIVSGVALVGVGMGTAFDSNRMASGVFRHGQIQSKDIVFHKDGHTATVDVFDSKDDVRAISTNGKPDAACACPTSSRPLMTNPPWRLPAAFPCC
jgi:spermidine synthase